MPANNMPKELRGLPLGERKNGNDAFTQKLYKAVFAGVHKEFKEQEIEYGFDLMTRSKLFFSVFDDDQMRIFCVRIHETS